MISVDLLKNFGLFEGFSDEDLRKFADLAIEETYKEGAQLWKKGDPAKSLLLLVEGKALMTMDIDAGPHRPPIRVTVDIVTKGEGLGWSAVVEPYLYTRTVRCLDNLKAVAFDAAKLREILDKDKALGYKFMHAISKVIRNRLAHTESILVGERGLSTMEDTSY
jgi:CRP-like cAMP-binding protein